MVDFFHGVWLHPEQAFQEAQAETLKVTWPSLGSHTTQPWEVTCYHVGTLNTGSCVHWFRGKIFLETSYHGIRAFPGGSVVKNPSAMQEPQEMWVGSLGQEDPLEEGMATHSSILAWRIPRTEGPGGPQSMGSRSRTRPKQCSTHTMGAALNHEGPEGFSHSGMAENQELLWSLGSRVNLQGNFWVRRADTSLTCNVSGILTVSQRTAICLTLGPGNFSSWFFQN